MNENIINTIASLMIDASNDEIEKLSIALICECAKLTDTWADSGEYATFGERLCAHFGVKK